MKRRFASAADVGRFELPTTTTLSKAPKSTGSIMGISNTANNAFFYKDKRTKKTNFGIRYFSIAVVFFCLGSSGVLFRYKVEHSNDNRYRHESRKWDMEREAYDSFDDGENSWKNPCDINKEVSFGGAVNPGYFYPEDAISGGNDDTFRFAIIADLDKLSRVEGAGKISFRSILLHGTLNFNNRDNKKYPYSIIWEFPAREILTHHNEGGRGAEYSELTLFDNRLLVLDDRTGGVVELLNHSPSFIEEEHRTYPVTRYVLTEGNGDSSKGMKWEWATPYNHGKELYIGGIGKEMQLKDSHIVDNSNPMWIAILNKENGSIRRVNWSKQYNFVRFSVGCQLPGYLAHEAVLWSDFHSRWIFLPRRLSHHEYDPHLDERLGSNRVILVNKEFTESTVIEIDLPTHQHDTENEHNMKRDDNHKDYDNKNDYSARGFSSFSFVPNTNDEHVLALRSVEENCVDDNNECKHRTYISVFELLTGEVLMEETLIRDAPYKFEGVEFVDIYTPPTEKKKT